MVWECGHKGFVRCCSQTLGGHVPRSCEVIFPNPISNEFMYAENGSVEYPALLPSLDSNILWVEPHQIAVQNGMDT